MFVCKSIQAEHKDLIHDVSYDFHGGRMATCSSDQTVKVWDKGDDGTWNLTATWKAHSGSVWRVVWAHPEFGQVLATCSFDRTAAIWEELVCETGVDGIKSQWVKKSSLVDSRTSVTDIKFAPKHLGLQLATCSSDGMVRIYEAPDMMNLSQWSLQNDFSCKLSCSCLDWNPSRLHAPMIAIGSDDANPSAGGKVHLYEYSDSSRKWTRIQTITSVTDIVHDLAFSPNLGRSCHILAIASKDLKVISLKPIRYDKGLSNRSGSEFEVRLVGQFNDHDSQVWRLAWNVIGTILASAGDDGRVRLWKANYLGSWKCISVLSGDANSGPSESGPHKHDYGASGGTNSEYLCSPMNIKRNSRWPYLNTKKDQGKLYY